MDPEKQAGLEGTFSLAGFQVLQFLHPHLHCKYPSKLYRMPLVQKHTKYKLKIMEEEKKSKMKKEEIILESHPSDRFQQLHNP